MLKVIIDVDTGVDDAWALLSFLADKENVNILGITTVKGNTTVNNVCQNTCRILSATGRTEVPVFKGAEHSLLELEFYIPDDYQCFFGINGFGDVPLPDSDLSPLQKENAVVALNRITETHKGEVVLVCLGPLTNIALATRTFSNFPSNVKHAFIMGGNYTALGNTTKCAEFNFHEDPEAAHIVLTNFERKLTLLPWETCLTSTIPHLWRFEEFRENIGPAISLINKIEKPVIERALKLGFKYWICCDQLLAAIVLKPEIVESKFDAHALIELSGIHTRGQIVIDHLNSREHNITIIKTINQKLLQQFLSKLKHL